MTSLLGAGVAVASDRVPAGRGRRAAARPDEDAITLAAEAARGALDGLAGQPQSIVLASTSAPYDSGGSVQPLVELLGLQGAIFAVELTATERDGLAALALAAVLVASGRGPVLVCAAHADHDRSGTGDGAVALSIGDGEGLADLHFPGSHAEELRDQWRLRGADSLHEADRSFVESIGTANLVDSLVSRLGSSDAPTLVVGPDARAAGRAEKALGGGGDQILPHVGRLGAAHSLLRLVTELDHPIRLVALGGGIADCVEVVPTPSAAAVAARLRAQILDGGNEVPRPLAAIHPDDFQPYSSNPRSWRERGVDLRLEGLIGDDPSGLPPGRRLVEGVVVTWTSDRVYPAAKATDMAIVDVDGGGRFFGQVIAGGSVEIGERVRLVPRRLHEGGDVVQYFWKVAPCQ